MQQQQNEKAIDKPSTSRTGGGESSQKGNVRQIQLKCFGESLVSFLNVPLTQSTQVVEIVKCADRRQYKIKTDGTGMVYIKYGAADTFAISLFNNGRWVSNLYINPMSLNIGNVGKAQATQVITLRTTENEPRNVHTNFKIDNQSNATLKRIDVRGHNTTWFSIFSHNSNMLMARPNGNWVAEKILYMTDQLTTQAVNNYRRTNGQEVLAPNDTAVMQRRTQSTNHQTSARGSTQENAPVTTAPQTVNVDAHEIEESESKREHAQRKEKYQREVTALQQKEQELITQRNKYEREAAELQERKQKLAEESAIIDQATNELESRREHLQREKDQFLSEKEEFEESKDVMPALVPNKAAMKFKLQEVTAQYEHKLVETRKKMARLHELNVDYDRNLTEMQKRTQELELEVKEFEEVSNEVVAKLLQQKGKITLAPPTEPLSDRFLRPPFAFRAVMLEGKIRFITKSPCKK